MLKNQIEAILQKWIDPHTDQNLIESKSLKRFEVTHEKVELDVTLGYPLGAYESVLSESLRSQIASVTPLPIELKLSVKIDAHVNGAHVPALKGVKNIIAVGSGKGGVGKSTVSFHLAQAIAKLGARVGVLDADIYGPSQPSMFGLTGTKPDISDGKFVPLVKNGMQTMSIGYLIGEDVPMIWRGPMIGKALQQIIADTAWDGIDYLIVDLPPGTGDIQLTLCQKIPVTGALVVTTPQDLALLDVRRACEMLKKLNVPILGVVENMSGHTCQACGHHEAIFGEGGGEKIATIIGETLFAHIPLDSRIREKTDSGAFFSNASDFHEAQLFEALALKVTGKIACMPKDYSSKFPTIKIEG